MKIFPLTYSNSVKENILRFSPLSPTGRMEKFLRYKATLTNAVRGHPHCKSLHFKPLVFSFKLLSVIKSLFTWALILTSYTTRQMTPLPCSDFLFYISAFRSIAVILCIIRRQRAQQSAMYSVDIFLVILCELYWLYWTSNPLEGKQLIHQYAMYVFSCLPGI